MALVIEDGSGLADAEAYEDLAGVTARLARLGLSLDDAETDEEGEAAILRATAYVEGIFAARGGARGSRFRAEQALTFPRSGVVIDGVHLDPATIPVSLLTAIAHATVREARAPGSLSPDMERGGQVVSESVSVGPVSESKTYKSTSPAGTSFTIIDSLLRPLLRPLGLTRT